MTPGDNIVTVGEISLKLESVLSGVMFNDKLVNVSAITHKTLPSSFFSSFTTSYLIQYRLLKEILMFVTQFQYTVSEGLTVK